MLKVRREHPEMGLGDFAMVDAGAPAIFAFERRLGDTVTHVVANFSKEPQVAEVGAGTDAMTGERVDGTVTLGPLAFRWIRREKPGDTSALPPP